MSPNIVVFANNADGFQSDLAQYSLSLEIDENYIRFQVQHRNSSENDEPSEITIFVSQLTSDIRRV